MKKIFSFILVLLSFTSYSQTLYSGTIDSTVKIPSNVAGSVRTIYAKDLSKDKQSNINVVNAKDSGAIGNGTTNDYANLAKVFVSNRTIVIPAGTFKISSTIVLNNISNLTIIGNAGSTITTSLVKQIFRFTGTCTNVRIEGVRLESTLVDATEDYYGLITFNNATVKNVKILKCFFTAPSCQTNGIKLISEIAVSEDIEVNNNTFENIGTMGVELQDHSFAGDWKVKGVKINDNHFKNLGTVSPYGHAISFTGQCENGNASGNTIIDAKNVGMEITLGRNISFTNNSFGYINGYYNPISISSVSGNGKNISVNGNTFLMTGAAAPCKVNMEDLDGFTFTGNTGTISELTIQSTNGVVSNNSIITDLNYSLFISNSTSCIFKGNNLVNTSANNYAIIGINNSSNNIIEGNRLKKTTGFSYQSIGSSANNYLRSNFDDDDATFLNGTINGATTNPVWMYNYFTLNTALNPTGGTNSPADATTYYFGARYPALVPASTSADQRSGVIAVNCTLVGYAITTAQTGAAATQENSTISVRKNNSTDILLSNAVTFSATNNTGTHVTASNLNVNFSAGDTWEMKWLTPTWATNPLAAQIVVTLYFKTR